MWLVELLVVAYVIVAILATAMAMAAIDKGSFRLIFIALGLAMPLIFLYSATTALFSGQAPPRFNDEMAKIEDDIETERTRIFGGETTCPSFSHHWEAAYQAYLDRLVQRVAKTSEKLASLGTAAGRI